MANEEGPKLHFTIIYRNLLFIFCSANWKNHNWKLDMKY